MVRLRTPSDANPPIDFGMIIALRARFIYMAATCGGTYGDVMTS